MNEPYKILLVDDEAEVRTSIIRKIDWSAVGFQVVGDAENGVDAKVSIKLKQYRAFTIGVNQINIEQKNGEIVATVQKQRQTTK